jgi:hypothetical protein
VTSIAQASTATPAQDQSLTNAVACIAENGATPEQAEAMREITRIVIEAGDPTGAARQLLDLIDAEKATPAPIACHQLDGQCVSHQDDHGTTIHRGAEHRLAGGEDGELLSHTLVQWGDDDTPGLQFVGGYGWPQLDLAQTDELIAAVEKQLTSLRECRTHLAAALDAAERATA